MPSHTTSERRKNRRRAGNTPRGQAGNNEETLPRGRDPQGRQRRPVFQRNLERRLREARTAANAARETGSASQRRRLENTAFDLARQVRGQRVATAKFRTKRGGGISGTLRALQRAREERRQR